MEEVGEVITIALTKFQNTMYIYNCVRKPVFVYEFVCRKIKTILLQNLQAFW